MTSDVSRRRFLETAAAAGTAGLLSGCTEGGRPASEAARRHRAVEEENARRGDPDWGIRQRGTDRAVEGFADRVSVLPGEDVRLCVSTTSRRFRIEAFRMGWYGGAQARKVWASAGLPGRRQPAPGTARATRTVSAAGWQPSTTVSTKGWPEGAYLLRLTTAAGDQRFVPVTVRSRAAAGRLLLVNAVATWQAYNTWGGRSLYHGPGGKGDYAARSLAVSCDRPYDDDGAHLFLVYEQPAIALAERLGVPLAYATSMDLDADPDLLTGAQAVVSLGHDEYWTPAMRDRVTAARDTGTNIAFLGANACFRRIRLEETDLGKRRMVVCYKTDWRQDPMAGHHDAAVTTDWREPPHADPENSLTGTRYESAGASAAYTVARPDHWLFEGTQVTRRTRFPHLVGTEYDRVAGDEYTPSPIEIIAHSPLTCRGVRSYQDSAYYTVPTGAGVFNTGTMRWVESLKGDGAHGITADASRMTRKVTENLLRAFAHERAGRRHPAHDDAAAHHAYAGDPVAQQHHLW